MNTVKVVTDLKGLAEEVTNLDSKVEAMYADAVNAAEIVGKKWDRNIVIDAGLHGLAIGLCVVLTKRIVELFAKQKELEDRVERLEREKEHEEE